MLEAEEPLRIGDPVKLTARFAAALMRSNSQKRRTVDWRAREGSVRHIRKNGSVLVQWPGRATQEELSPRALQKVPSPS